MTAKTILEELSTLGRESYKRVLMKNHGVREPCFGVPISELKKIQRRVKKDYRLALELYDTGNYDAMYLAGLIADDPRMTPPDLQRWVEKAYGGPLAGSTVPWVAAGSPHGYAIALKWIESGQNLIAAAGWATLSCLVALKPDTDLDLDAIKGLLERARTGIHRAPDAVRYHMNAFVIAVGIYVAPLSDLAVKTAEEIGPVNADLGNNDCQIPCAPDYIKKAKLRGLIGKKRKTVKC